MKKKSVLPMALALIVAAVLAGCATQPQVIEMEQPSGQQQQMTMPKSTWTGEASGTQADALAKQIQQGNNNTMQQFDQVEGNMGKLQGTENKDLQTSQQALAKFEQLSAQQGSGQITLFFKTGSAEFVSVPVPAARELPRLSLP